MPTGFADLDEMTRGLQGGDLIIVAARPSMGKTSLVLNIAQHVAMQPDTDRRLLQPGNVEGVAVHPAVDVGSADRQSSPDERCDRAEGLRPHLAGARDAERDALFIDDSANVGVLEMRAKSRRLQAEHGLNLLVVDYIQLMSARGRYREPNAGARVDFAIAEGACEGAEHSDRGAVAALARARIAL